jgi:hypothetical protein
MSDELKELYGPAIVVNSEGSRLALVSCRKCGATVMFEPLDFTPSLESIPNGVVIHLEWHKAQEEEQ